MDDFTIFAGLGDDVIYSWFDGDHWWLFDNSNAFVREYVPGQQSFAFSAGGIRRSEAHGCGPYGVDIFWYSCKFSTWQAFVRFGEFETVVLEQTIPVSGYPVGDIWADDQTLYVVATSDPPHLYAYDRTTLLEDTDKGFALSDIDPGALWGDGEYIYIVNVDNATIQAYDLAGNRVAARDVPVPDG